MSFDSAKLVAELSHEINSPLAAIRNALYLVGCRTADSEIHRYLQIADDEVVSIAGFLRDAQLEAEFGIQNGRSRSKAA